ncbi:hypothetical protein PN498_16910 [Oscillatoria sp. CS-180]|uniref:hypothetical protein n=1 Tax=Oscillatoria sp. CS-180 TaxID=3021720 RepID=UPI00232E021A|nr:hypothetical protein [Oscillatoria sp. CS-180]MDB9527678.1 hypothetical protein [Oscillatoria sp. CS-180]
MPLAPGTALQNGHYVIDALLDAAPNGDLYWGTHVVSGMRVFIQIFPLPPEDSCGDLSALIARLEGIAFSPQSPLPNPFQLFREGDRTLCLTMGTTIGLPWSSLRKSSAPLSPKQALETIRHVANHITWLAGQGISSIDLSPNRIWLTQDYAVTLTGLPLAYLNQFAGRPMSVGSPDGMVPFLSRLLYSFLTGEILESAQMMDSVGTHLSQKQPSLSPLIVQAISQGIQPEDGGSESRSLRQWLDQLPDADAPHQISSPRNQLMTRPAQPADTRPAQPTSPQKVKKRLYPALLGTAFLAAIGGVTLGTVWRLSAKNLPGAIQFDPNQSFPEQTEWSGDDPEAAFDSPYIPAREQEDWFDSDMDAPPQEPIWEAPANAADWPDEVPPAYVEPEVNEDTFADEEPVEPDTFIEETPIEAPREAERMPPVERVPQDFSVPPIRTPVEEGPANFSDAAETFPQNFSETEPKAAPASEATSEG